VLKIIQFITTLSLKIALKYSFKISLKSESYMKTISQRLKPESFKTRQHKTDRLTPDSCQTQTPPDTATLSLVCVYCYQSRHRQNLISTIFSPEELRNRAAKRDGHQML
jgi:hypothetical protein